MIGELRWPFNCVFCFHFFFSNFFSCHDFYRWEGDFELFMRVKLGVPQTDWK